MADPPTLRKIQLDSIDDLCFIYDNLVKNAREKIDVHIPPATGGAVDGVSGEGKKSRGGRKTRRSTGGAKAGEGESGGGDGDGGGGEGEDPLRKKVEELVMEVSLPLC